MLVFVIRRLLIAVPLLIAVLFATFMLLWMLPGDPTVALLGDQWNPVKAEQIRESQGLNDPVLVQFKDYLSNVAKGDFGEDLKNQPVARELRKKIPATMELALAAMLIATLVGVSAGILSALKPGSWRDLFTLTGALAGVSFPIFWLGLLAQRVFSAKGALNEAVGFAGLPTQGRLSPQFEEAVQKSWTRSEELGESSGLTGFHLIDSLVTFKDFDMFLDALAHLALPALVLSTVPAAVITRITRTAVIEQLQLDYTRTARAKGVTPRRLMLRHVLRNAMIPIVTSIGTLLGYLLGGAVLTEKIFTWHGVGTYMVDAILALDARPLQMSVMIVAVGFVLINLIVDVSYGLLDPRVRQGGQG